MKVLTDCIHKTARRVFVLLFVFQSHWKMLSSSSSLLMMMTNSVFRTTRHNMTSSILSKFSSSRPCYGTFTFHEGKTSITSSSWMRAWFSSTTSSSPLTTTTTLNTATNSSTPIGLDAFRDSVPREIRMRERVGRSWSVKELRRKSYDDCQKLWYVMLVVLLKLYFCL
jgi:hypothetical protein